MKNSSGLICLPYKIVIMRFIIGTLVLGVVFAKQEGCGRNAHYTKCGTSCPLTCNNADNPPDSCGTKCVEGCQCDEGFVLYRNFVCVKPKYCPKPSNRDVCGENERYNRCATYCTLTCENYTNLLQLGSNKKCPAVCKRGCGCKDGFLRRADGKCVKPEECENKLVPPKVVIKDNQGQQLERLAGPYDEGTSLSLVCEAEGGNPAPSISWWKNGLLIDDTYSLTSQGSTRNEIIIMELKRSDFMEEFICQAANANRTLPIHASVKIDLNMKPVYVRITTPQTPVKLGEALELHCETSGSRPDAKIVWWIDNELIQNENQSFFSQINGSDGNITYSRILFKPGIDDNGKAVICKAENPALPHIDMRDTWVLLIHYNVCGENERYNECGTHCPLSCENYDIPNGMCPDVCDEGCECEYGFIRRVDGKCVRLEDCGNQRDKILANCTDCPDPGICDATLSRFYYDSEEKRCKEFIFGGCGGNTNNFKTEEDCRTTCGDNQ